jgi:hypothetical protein
MIGGWNAIQRFLMADVGQVNAAIRHSPRSDFLDRPNGSPGIKKKCCLFRQINALILILRKRASAVSKDGPLAPEYAAHPYLFRI